MCFRAFSTWQRQLSATEQGFHGSCKKLPKMFV